MREEEGKREMEEGESGTQRERRRGRERGKERGGEREREERGKYIL